MSLIDPARQLVAGTSQAMFTAKTTTRGITLLQNYVRLDVRTLFYCFDVEAFHVSNDASEK